MRDSDICPMARTVTPTHSKKARRREPIRMAFVLVPQFPMLAFASAIEPLRAANRLAEETLFEWTLATVDGKPVCASNGIEIAAQQSLEILSRPDMVVVCAGLEPLQFGRTHAIHHQLRRIARHGAKVGAISSGAFILADAGLLTDRRATVHWEYAELFRTRFPQVRLTRALFDQPIGARSFGTVWRRQLRWSKVRRLGFPRLYLAEILAGSALPLLAALILAGLGVIGPSLVLALMLQVLVLMQLTYILMGMFLDDTAMLIIVAPLYVPLIISLALPTPLGFSTLRAST